MEQLPGPLTRLGHLNQDLELEIKEVTIPSLLLPQILLNSGQSLEESQGCSRMFLVEVFEI